jgi:hypothetical protein
MSVPQLKVVFVMYVPLTAHFEARFHILDLIQSGITVELWDVTNLYFNHIAFSEAVERKYVVKLMNFAEVERRLDMAEIPKTVFVFLLHYSFRTLELFALFSRHRCRTCTFVQGLQPSGSSIASRWINVRRYLGHMLDPKKMSNYFLSVIPRIYKRLYLIREYDTVFVSGSVATGLYEGKSQVVQVNYFDYDNYLEAKGDQSSRITGDYCVFLDGNLAEDSDNRVLGLKTVTPQLYFKGMNLFFDRIEKSHGTTVVIAASPKSKYADGIFGPRRLYKNQTHELIKGCSFVIADYSTAVAYAVLYKKPIVFYYTEEMKRLSFFTYIVDLAATLDCRIYSIDLLDDSNPLSIKPVNLKRYEKYKYSFLTSKESENLHSRDILVDYFRKIRPMTVQSPTV